MTAAFSAAASASRRLRFCLGQMVIGCAALVSVAGHAATDSLAMTPVQWKDQHERSPQGLVGLGTELFGDKVDLFTGGLQFVQTDVSLPGNDRLSVAVERKYTVGRREFNRHFGDWDIEIPHLTGYFPPNTSWLGVRSTSTSPYYAVEPLARCTYFGAASIMAAGYYPKDFWQGGNLYIPGAGQQEILKRDSVPGNPIYKGPNTLQPTDGNAYPLVTKGNWQIRCLGSLARGSGEGFLALSPDGTQYRFDWMVNRAATPIGTPGHSKAIDEVWIMPTQVRDRFGNTVTYTYDSSDPWRLVQISSSDGRHITLNYNGNGRIYSVTDGTRTWVYNYDGDGSLISVVQPDNKQWTFSMKGFSQAASVTGAVECGQAGSAPGYPFAGTLTHPSGASGTFTSYYTFRSRTGFRESCAPDDGDPNTPILGWQTWSWIPLSLTSKVLNGPGLGTLRWTYEYGKNSVSDDALTITAPDSSKTRYSFGNYYNRDYGLLKQVDEGWDPVAGTALRTTVNTYITNPQGQPYPEPLGYSDRAQDPTALGHRPTSRREIRQQGVTMAMQVNTFDALARPTSITRSSSPGISRTESTQYYDQLGLWVLGQVQSQIVAGVEANRIDYDASNALPAAYYHFGVLQNRYAFRADGTLSEVRDGLNRATSYSDFKRGTAQYIGYADGNYEARSVNDTGWLMSRRDLAGFTTSYGYDSMGRLSSITPPGGFAGTTMDIAPVPSAEYGLPAGHWRQVQTQGNAVTVTYYDALWRPVMTRTYDAQQEAATRKVVVKAYDFKSRAVFESYPQRDLASVTATSPGTRSQFDALGRPIRTEADSELGVLATTTDYLSGLQTRITNARGKATTQSFWVLDDPGQAQLASIAAPAGVNVSISRDTFGKPTAITRSGSFNGYSSNVTRRYVYDGGQRLCKTLEPEVGATVQTYDGAGNIAWKAPGLNLPDTAVCNDASVADGSKIVYGYDTRNRLTSVTYGDGSPGVGRTYTPDGLLETISSAGSTWTYGYNALRKPATETLAYAGQAYGLNWGYNSQGALSTLTYPDSSTISYSPNALGEAQGVSGYASGISYHPNGAVAGYTLGNGIVHSLTQNTRGLPLVNRDAGVMQDQYAYDANGNVLGITDQQEGVFSRSMGYDDLDRLTSTSAPNVWGSATYVYDPVDNLRSAVVGSRNSTFNFDANNQLASVTTNGGTANYGFDARGNLTTKGGQSFGFDLGNRLSSSSLGGSYAYDGHGRRFLVNSSDGSSRLQVYSQAGQLLWATSTGGPRAASSTAYVYLGGKQISEVNSASGTQYVHADGLSSPVAHSNTSGAVISRSRFEPYGYVAAGTKPSANSSVIGFTGHVQDAETDLVYMQQRYYDPNAGRFLSVDPIVTDANTGKGFGLYTYVDNNPYSKIDPDGRQALPFMLPPPPPVAIPGKAQQGPDGPLPPSTASGPKIQLPAFPITTPIGAMITIIQATQAISNAGTPQSPAINPADVAGKTPTEIGQVATGAGLVPKGPDPLGGKGAFVDPVTGEQRVLVHGDHAHVNDTNGNRLDINGNKVKPESPEAHLPVKQPPPPKPQTP